MINDIRIGIITVRVSESHGQVNFQIFIFGLIITLIGYLYSAKPFRFKSRPLIDIISHGFFLAEAEILIFALLPGSQFDVKTLLIAIGVYLFSMGGDLYNELRDWIVDREVGLKNTASILGYNVTRILSYLFYGIGVLSVLIASVSIIFKL